MNPSHTSKTWIILGWLSCGAILLFVLSALLTLFIAGGAETNWPPIGYVGKVTMFTFLQAVLSTLLSVVLALPVALALARREKFPGRTLIIGLMILPLGLPVLPAVFGLVEIWGRQGAVNDLLHAAGLEAMLSIYGLAGILLGHVFFNLPLAARLMLRTLEQVPQSEWRLAASLGFSRWQLFRFVEWPAISRVVPGIAGLILMLCVTSFTIVLMLGGGPQTSTLEVAIYQSLKFDYDPPRALLLTLLQLVLTALLFVALRAFPDPDENRSVVDGRAFRVHGKGLAAKAGDALVILLFFLFVASPLAAVALSGLAADMGHLLSDPLFWQAFWTSCAIAVSAGVLAVTIAVLTVRAGLAFRSGFARGMLRLPEIMLLLPPLALGSGWFILLLKLGIDADGAVSVVIVINMLMALPFSSRVLAPDIRTHLLRNGRLADSLGIRGWHRIKLIDWPVLRAPLLTALGFGMALSLGDMGAIALFGSENFITLPALLYAKLGSYRSTDAAGLALVLGVLCLLLMLPALRADRLGGEGG